MSTSRPNTDHIREGIQQTTQNTLIIVSFESDELENPYNWSICKKTYVLITGMIVIMNSTLGTALPSEASSYIGDTFNVTNDAQLTMPVSAYLLGYVLGPLIFGPLSEARGRRPVLIWTFLPFTIFTLTCAVAPTFTSLVIFRLLTGIFASAPTAIIGGLYADIYASPLVRGRAMALFMACVTLAPSLGPLISGYISTVSWRWTFWVGLIFAGVSIPPLLFLPETYGPILLLHKAQKMRDKNPEKEIIAPIEAETHGWQDVVTRVLTRPIRMIFSESIVLFTCLYLSLAYSIFYLFFEAYPIVFQGVYGFSNALVGLAFIPIGVGSLLAFPVFIIWDSILSRAHRRGRPWVRKEEYRRLPLACLGGPLFAGSIFWLAWTSSIAIHPAVPILAGLPFGLGFLLIFMALINYLADAYEIFAASALAAASCTRSVCGALVPLAAHSMYATLGIHWATSLLGFASLAMAVIPFMFIAFGDYLHAHSKFSRRLKEIKAKQPPVA